MANKHFPGTGDCLIHTDRDSPQCTNFSPCAHHDVAGKLAFEPQNPHHIMPVATIIAYQSEEKYKDVVTKISAAYRGTKYCTNQANNIIWLPKKDTYSNHKKTSVWPTVWELNLPCHNWDHYPRYNEEVKVKLRADIWDSFVPQEPPEPCPGPKKIQIALKDVEDYFREELKKRGKRMYKGTLGAIQGAEVGKPKWWFDFSMAKMVRDEPIFSFGKKSRIPVALLRLSLNP